MTLLRFLRRARNLTLADLGRAYLLPNPEAANAPAVREQVKQLEIVYEHRLSNIVDVLEPAVKAIIDGESDVVVWNDQPGLKTSDTVEGGGILAAMRLYLGDKVGAEKTRQLFLY